MFISTALASEAASNSASSGLMSLLPMVLIFGIFYFLLIRPQEKKRKDKEALIKGVKKGEQVLTSGGMYGVVAKLHDDETVDLEIADKTIIRIQRASLVDIPSRGDKAVQLPSAAPAKKSGAKSAAAKKPTKTVAAKKAPAKSKTQKK